jgi:hypothetical protein
MKENENELRELDAWIAEHVMGFEYPCIFEPTGGTGEICALCNHHAHFDRHLFPHYSTDPASAFQVLEKCLERLESKDLRMWKGITKGMYFLAYGECDEDRVKAETLPLAIALFSKKLYGEL